MYTYTYSLHWWLFDLKGSLKHVGIILLIWFITICVWFLISQVCERQLFCGEEIDLYLQLVVCQTPDGRHVVVMGCRYVILNILFLPLLNLNHTRGNFVASNIRAYDNSRTQDKILSKLTNIRPISANVFF